MSKKASTQTYIGLTRKSPRKVGGGYGGLSGAADKALEKELRAILRAKFKKNPPLLHTPSGAAATPKAAKPPK